MLTIRLQRVGRKNDPSFRVVVTESKRKPQTGNYLEMVGSYDARLNKTALKTDRIKHWIAMGATTSETVHNILVTEKVIDAKKINVLPRKSPPAKEGEEVAAAAVAPTATSHDEASSEVAAPTENAGVEASVKEGEDNAVAPEAEAK